MSRHVTIRPGRTRSKCRFISIEDSRESEPCPENSVLTEDGKCECAPCPRPTCQPGHRPVQLRAALDRETPGRCCPLYECKPAGNGFINTFDYQFVLNIRKKFDRWSWSCNHWKQLNELLWKKLYKKSNFSVFDF